MAFLPANLILIEFIGTTGSTVQLTSDMVGDAITITGVTYSAEKIPEDLNITWSGDSFTFSSKFDNIFDRTLKYLIYKDLNSNVKKYYTVKRFDDVPLDAYGLHEYIAPASDYSFGDFIVNYTSTLSGSGTATWTLTIEHDWDSSNKKFVAIVARGTEYLKAKERYPELK